LFAESKVYIPPAVLEEVQVGINKGRTYLNTLLQAITDHQIIILPLTSDEIRSLDSLPRRLNAGERQAIALAQHRQGVLLSNDRRAVRYCEQQGIRSLVLGQIYCDR
jgi:predicted nucleic acid-binding protein